MAAIKLKKTIVVEVPEGCKQIKSGDKDFISFAFRKDTQIFYYTSPIDEVPNELHEEKFIVINSQEVKEFNRLLNMKN